VTVSGGLLGAFRGLLGGLCCCGVMFVVAGERSKVSLPHFGVVCGGKGRVVEGLSRSELCMVTVTATREQVFKRMSTPS
jgi:hypothetical protein